jgi:hypothetical protein
MSEEYHDRWITCTAEAIEIRGYYFPWGTKRVPYARIRRVTRVTMGALTGRARIWGTFDVRYWASLDPGRPGKRVGLILDAGASIRPFITPDDPQAVMDAIHAHTGSAVFRSGHGPIL